MGLAERFATINAAVAAAAHRVGRDPAEITLVGVSKTVGRADVDAAYALGLRHVGENRVQEAMAKFTLPPPVPSDLKLHLIGQLQTNKARPAAQLFHLIESVDRPALIAALAREGERLGRRIAILLQVNIANEPQKAGCSAADAQRLVDLIRASQHLTLHGLMTIAPLVPEPEAARPVFRDLRVLRDALQVEHGDNGLPVLSMGMSNDYPVAIEEGATHIRVGRALFGA